MLARIFLPVLGCLCVAPSFAQLNGPDLVEVLYREGDPAPGFPAGWTIRRYGALSAGADGGWISAVEVVSPTSSSDRVTAFYGQRSGQLDGPLELLRTAGTLGGVRQDAIRAPAWSNGRIAYQEAQQLTSTGRSVWLDDVLMLSVGDAYGPDPAWAWGRPSAHWLRDDGALIVMGLITRSSPFAIRFVFFNLTTGEEILGHGDVLPGLPHPVQQIQGPFGFSPNGRQFGTKVIQEVDGRRALTVNGRVLEVAPGALVLEGELIPPDLNGGVSGQRWGEVRRFEINNAGDYAFTANIQGLGQSDHLLIRNGRLMTKLPGPTAVSDIDARGALLTGSTTATSRPAFLEGALVVAANPGVDIDRDGQPDAGYSMPGLSIGGNVFVTRDGEAVIGLASVQGPSGDFGVAVCRARRARVDALVCDGVPNSTGRSGEILAAGSPLAASNEMTLQLFDLPTALAGYVVLSRTFGMSVNPDVHAGILCVQGSAGRLTSQMFVPDATGRANVTLDLTALPQPVGNVPAQAGETWFAQAWHRDALGGATNSNFTSAIAILFQ